MNNCDDLNVVEVSQLAEPCLDDDWSIWSKRRQDFLSEKAGTMRSLECDDLTVIRLFYFRLHS